MMLSLDRADIGAVKVFLCLARRWLSRDDRDPRMARFPKVALDASRGHRGRIYERDLFGVCRRRRRLKDGENGNAWEYTNDRPCAFMTHGRSRFMPICGNVFHVCVALPDRCPRRSVAVTCRRHVRGGVTRSSAIIVVLTSSCRRREGSEPKASAYFFFSQLWLLDLTCSL